MLLLITISWIWLPLVLVVIGLILMAVLSIFSEDFQYIIGIPLSAVLLLSFWFYVVVGLYYGIMWLINNIQIV